jgi:uncharacterized cofD-like protein
VTGNVVPISLDDHQLVMIDKQGNRIEGEHLIGKTKFLDARPNFELKPTATLNKHAKTAIEQADIVMIAPGNLYASLAPALIVGGVGKALKKSKAKVVYVCNLVTKPGQTDGFQVHDYADEIERLCGGPVLDFVIFNTDEPTPQMLKKYTRDGEYVIEFDLNEMENRHYTPIGLPLVDKTPVEYSNHDVIGKHTRTLIRHNSDAVAREAMKLYFS